MSFDFTHQFEAKVFVNDSAIAEYPHTDGNSYVEGRAGSRYHLYFRNHSPNEKVMVVPSVDGLSIFDGKVAGLDSQGYVINPSDQLKIPGWTVDPANVAEFVFSDLRDSYLAKTGGNQSNAGVIGFLVFREKWQPPINSYQLGGVGLGWNPLNPYPPYWYGGGGTQWPMGSWSGPWSPNVSFNCGSSVGGGTSGIGASIDNATGGRSVNMAETQANMVAKDVTVTQFTQTIGTGFGEKTEFQTYQTTFTKRDPQHPDAMMVIYYDSIRGLRKRGIKVGEEQAAVKSAFPGYSSTGCVPPTGWKS